MNLDCIDKKFDFTGSKIALICGDKVLTILRDDKDDIPCPNMWELPGGGREGNESPFECAAREVYKELGIHGARSIPACSLKVGSLSLWSVS